MRVHIVQKGDTLWKIAKQYGIGFDELKRLNAQLANPDYIVPGMEIFLPEKGETGGKETVKGDKHKVMHEMKEKEIEWKPSKELQYVEESIEVPQLPMHPEPTYNPYAFMPSIYQMAYMPTYQQPIYQMPVYQQPIYQAPMQQIVQPPMQHQPVFEESAEEEMVEKMPHEEVSYEHEIYQQPMMHHQPMHHQPMFHQPCGCHQPMYHQPMHHQSCGCHQPMHHQPMFHQSCGCHQPMHHQPMFHHSGCHEPMYHQPMYQQPMYYQPMEQSTMYQPADVCESSRPFCPEKEEQVKGYYDEIRQIEHATKTPCAPTPFPYSTQQHWQ